MTHNLPPRHLLRAALICFALALGVAAVGMFCAGCASSTLGKSLNVTVVASATADIVSTRQGLAAGAVEMNPLVGSSFTKQVLFKAAGVGVILAGTQAIEKDHKVLAHILRATASAVWFGAAIHNVRVIREMR